MSRRGVRKNWRLIITPVADDKPTTLVKAYPPSREEVYAIHNRGAAVKLVYVHPDTGERRIELELPGLGDAPEGMKRCGVCGTAAKVDEFNRFTTHVVGTSDEPCEHIASPDEHGPFVLVLPDFRPGDKVARLDTDFADLSPEDADLAIGTVVDVAPTQVRVSWPTGGYELEDPHGLRTVNVACARDGSRREPVRVHVPEAPGAPDTTPPALDTPTSLALHRPAGVPDAPDDYSGPVARFVFPATGDNRIALYDAEELPLGIISHGDVPDRRGSTVAGVLRSRGYRIIGLIAKGSTPGDPVYAIAPIVAMRGFRAAVLTGPRTDPRAAIGFRENWVTIVDADMSDGVRQDWADDYAPPVRVEHDELSRPYLVPMADPPAGGSAWAASGAYVDVRNPEWGATARPVPLHDLGAS